MQWRGQMDQQAGRLAIPPDCASSAGRHRPATPSSRSASSGNSTPNPAGATFLRFIDRGLREQTVDGGTAYDGLDSVGFLRALEPGETADFLAQRRDAATAHKRR